MGNVLDQYGEIWLGDFEYLNLRAQPDVRCGCFRVPQRKGNRIVGR